MMQSADVPKAYAIYIYSDAFDWLQIKGIRQWLLKLPESNFAQRQSQGEAYAIHVDGKLIGSVFLVFETIAYYGETMQQEPRWWLHTLVIDRAWAGQRIGEQAISAANAIIQARGSHMLWLHCVGETPRADEMPRYYTRLDFIETLRTLVTYPSGNTFPMVVMKRSVDDH